MELELVNYRGFLHYQMAGLRSVNLLVGDNNCGKTTVLEALHLLAVEHKWSALAKSAFDRGEVLGLAEGRVKGRTLWYPDINHLFHGHELKRGLRIEIKTGKWLGNLKATIKTPMDEIRQATLFDKESEISHEMGNGGWSLSFEGPARTHEGPARTHFPVSMHGALLERRVLMSQVGNSGDNVHFVNADSLGSKTMSLMWNQVLLDTRESEVIETMKILDPRIQSIFFLADVPGNPVSENGGILVSFKGERKRVPLGSLGEGVRRLLALALSLVLAKDGVLLIDEIDTGLHYSIMGDLWRLVVQTAVRSNVHVFATSHSWDCIRGLAALCENIPDLGKQVSIQKIDPLLKASVSLSAAEIITAMRQGIEVR